MEKNYSRLSLRKQLVKTVSILLFFVLLLNYQNAKAQCLNIQSILVDACITTSSCPSAQEGENEMVLIKVGSSQLTISYATTTSAAGLVPTWPSNSFLGWQQPNTTTGNIVTALNSTIVSPCGLLIEPTNGKLPANAKVLIITSTNMCTASNPFNNLTETLYVIFQIAGNTGGHFGNANASNSSNPRTLTMAYTGSGACSETVSYIPDDLVNQAGLTLTGCACSYSGPGGFDGGTVHYDNSGNPTYVNYTCQAPFIPMTATISAPTSICSNATPTIKGILSGPATTYTWATSGTGTISAPTGTLTGTGTTTVSPTYTPGTGESGTITFTLSANGAGTCTASAVTSTVSVAISPAPSPTVTSSNGAAICNGSSTVLTASGPGTYTYTWNPGSHSGTSFTVSPTSTQIYTVAVTNTCGTTNAHYTVTVNPTPTISIVPSTTAICSGGGSSTLTASGGSTYVWTPTVTLSAATGSVVTATPTSTTAATVYTVTGTDANSCVNTKTVSITVTPLPTLTLTTGSSTVCSSASTTLTASGANTFTWSSSSGGGLSGASGASVTVTPTSSPATYTVVGTSTVTGCQSAIKTTTVTITATPTISLTQATYTTCLNSPVTFTASGVSAGNYSWTPTANMTGSTSANPTVTPSTTTTTIYSVTGSASGCTSAANTVTLTVNPLPTYSLVSNTYTICNGSSQTFTVSGANTYTWTPTATLTNANTANPTASPTTTTVYSVTGTSSLTCENTTPATVTVTVNPKPTYTLAGNAYTICEGSSQTFTVSGASTYTWTPAATLTNANTANPTASPNTTTVYSVTGTSSLTCGNTTPVTVTVTVNSKPTYTLAANSYTICNGGSQTFTVSGANTYTWTPAATLTNVNTANPTANPTTTTVYSVTGTSSLSCTNATPATVTVNITSIPSLSLTANSYTICTGSSQTFTATGANTYTWTPTATLTNPHTASPTANPTTTTIYTVAGTASGCAPSSPLTLTLTVNSLPTISITPSSTAICSGGGSSTLTASGASTYTWAAGATLSTTTGSVVTATPTNTAAPTVYTVTGTDANSCINKNTVSITVNPTPTISVVGGGGNSQTVCGGGLANATVTAITFTSNPSGSVNWTNSNAGIGTAASGSGNIASYSAPTVTAQTTGIITASSTVAGCTSTNSTALNYTITINPIPGETGGVTSPAGCGLSDGTVIGAAGTGGSTYSYEWNNAGGFVASSSYTNAAGTYPLQIKDNVTGCIFSQNFTIPNAGAPTAATPVASATAVCVGGIIVLTEPTIAGTTYNWTEANGTTGTGNTYTVTNIPTSPNPYTIGVTATAASCTGVANTTSITINPLPNPSISASPTQICQGSSTTLSVTPIGAYSYQWGNTSSGIITGATSSTLSVTTVGVYSVTVTNTATSCSASTVANGTISVNPLPTLTLTASQSPSICLGSSTSFTASGASTYTWSSSASGGLTGTSGVNVSATPTTTANATYTVNATDVNGCNNNASITINVNPLPTILVTPSSTAICSGGGSSTLTASGATTYTWAPGATLSITTGSVVTATPTNIAAPTVYTVTGTDVNSCVNTNTVSITVNPTPTISIVGGGSNSQLVCGGGLANATVTAITFTSNPSGSVDWTNSNASIGVLVSGSGNIASYSAPTITVQTTGVITASSTVAGCTSTNSTALNYTITINPIPGETGGVITPAGCGLSNGTVIGASGTGGSTYSYEWNNAGGFVASSSYTNAAGTYTLQIKDNVTGCIYSQNFTIPNAGAPAQPVLTAAGNDTTYCQGDVIQTLTVTVANSGTVTPTINWYSDAGLNTTLATNTNTYTPSGLSVGTTILYVAAIANGCTSTSRPITITINPAPTPPVLTAPTGNNNSYCQGSPVPLTVNSGTAMAVWYSGNTIVNVGSIYTPATNLAAGTYTYSVIDSIAIAGGCVSAQASANTVTLTLVVNPLPTTPILTAPTSTNNSYCEGSPVPLTVNSGTATAVWYSGNTVVNVGASYTPSTTNYPAGTYTFSVIDSVAVINGCINAPASANTTTLTLVVNPLPTAPILTVPTGANNSYCEGSPVPLTVNSGTATAVWYSGNTVVNVGASFTPSTTNYPAGTYTFSVIDSIPVVNGCINAPQSANTVTLTLVVNPLPTAPILTAPTGTNNSYCEGLPVPLIVNSGTATAVWYNGNTVVNVGSTFTPSTINYPAGTYTFSVIDSVAVTNGCINAPASANTTTLTLVVNPTPTAPILTAPTSTNNSYCEGSPVPLTVNSGTATAVWYSGNTVVNVGSSFTPSTTNYPAGTYTFSVIDSVAVTNGCINAPQSANTNTLTLVVNPLPTAPVLTAPTGTNNSYCEGSPVPLTVNSGTAMAVWYNSNAVVNMGSSFTPPANLPAGTYTYSVIDSIPMVNGCINAPQSANTTTLTLVVNPLPTAPVLTAPTSTNNSYCQGSPVPLTVNSGTNTAVWYSGNTVVNVGSSFTPSTTNYPAGTYTFSVIDSVAVTNGCINAPASANTTILTLIVNSLPIAPVLTAPTSTNNMYCAGLPTPLTVNSGTNTAVWYSGNTVVNIGSSFTPSTTNYPAGTYTFSVIDSVAIVNGCINAPASANTTTLTLVVNPKPTVDVSSALLDSARCGQATGGVINLSSINVSGGPAPFIFQWTNTSTGAIVSTSPTFTNQLSGTYSLQVTDNNGCVANVTGGSSTFTVPSTSGVIASAITNPNPASGSIPLAISFSNTSTGATSYNWSFGDGNSSTLTNPINTYTNVGTYSVVLAAINGTCSDTFKITVIANLPTTVIIPNIFSPNGDGINDEFFIINTGMQSLNCDIFNRWGQLLFTITAPDQSWDGVTPNGDKAPDGTYMYLFQAQGLDGKTYKQQGTLMLVR